MMKTFLPALLGLILCSGTAHSDSLVGQVCSLDSPDQWMLSADPANVGKAESWWTGALRRETGPRSWLDPGDARRIPRCGLVLAHRKGPPPSAA